MTGPPLLDVRDLRVSFPTRGGVADAVDGVSFSVHEGEVLGLVGESGCGKTVTALSLMGLLEGSGARLGLGSSVRLRGVELIGVEARHREARGRRLAMVFQEPTTALNPVQAVGDQVAEVARWHLGLGRRAGRARALELLHEVGLEDPAHRYESYPHQLSGGMRQRVMIAAALAGEPELLIADEPTTALDVTVQAQILELLDLLRVSRGLSVLLITHDLGVVAGRCDRVLVMYAGQLVESAEVGELFTSPAHPYTQALLACLPTVGGRDDPLHPIPGSVPSPDDWPSGCRFHPRCARAWDRCEAEPPPLLPVPGSDRETRCWLAEPPRSPASPAHAERGGS